MIALQDAKAAILNWCKTGTRLPDDYSGWHLAKGEPSGEKLDFWKLAISVNYPLPDDFAHWDAKITKERAFVRESHHGTPVSIRPLRDDNEKGGYVCTLAHYAASTKFVFPKHFTQWAMLDSEGVPLIFLYLDLRVRIPKGFDQWDIEMNGTTVAHAYLRFTLRPLPAKFSSWGLKNLDGIPVAHRSAHLAISFDRKEIASFPSTRAIWHLRDANDNTILHLYAKHGEPIPDVFALNDWHLANKQGQRVIDVAREAGNQALVAQYEALELVAGIQFGKTVKSSFQRGSM